jgi:peptidoglycan pentaglycine glycine transferase (the first glycine)
MPVCSISEWNQYIKNFPEAHFMQTGEWGLLKSSFGWDVSRIINSTSGAQILLRRLPFGFTIAYLPKGPLGEDFANIWPEVDQICRQHRVIFLKVEIDNWQDEPLDSEAKFPGFITSQFNIQPPNTIIINLEQDESIVLQKMRQKTRYNINLAAKKEVSVSKWNDIATFHSMITITGGRDGFGVHSQDYYQRVYDLFHPAGMCELLVAKYGDQPLAALMVFARGKRSWYVYGASSDQERNRMPAYLLQWEAIRWARNRGCQVYDLWGIPDQDQDILEANFLNRNDGLWGVYRFKRGFGGESKRAHQALDKVYIPILYSIYQRLMASRQTAG